MANITTNTLKIEDNYLILRDADAQAKLTTHTQKIAALEEDTSSLKDDINDLGLSVVDGAINITYQEVRE